MASQGSSSDVHLSIKWPERGLYRSNNMINGSQLVKMKKNIPDMSLPWNL